MELQYHLLDVFTDRPFGGNQLAVFPDPPELPTPLMQAIARELNLSETVFVYPPTVEGAARKLRIFTPGAELPFAGHPTIGTAHLLLDLGMVGSEGSGTAFAFEEGVGLVPIGVRQSPNGARFVQLTAAKPPEAGPPVPSNATLATLVSVDESDVGPRSDPAQAVSAGVPFLFIPIKTRRALARATLDLSRWQQLLSNWWAPQVYLFCREAEGPGVHFRVRMFAPAFGVPEDPATGAAAAAFAGYLAWRAPETDGTLRWEVEQGMEMGRPSRLSLEADKEGGSVRAVRVGGGAVRIGSGQLTVSV